jgi:hypothetical protein
MTKEQLIEYASIKAQIKALTQRETEMKRDIQVYMIENGADKIEAPDVGTFSLARRKSWVYPQRIVEMEADLIVAKKKAEAKGEATYTDKPYFVFKEVKEEE